MTVPVTPGTLPVFAGRHSVHRVAPIRGRAPRRAGLFADDTTGGDDSTEVLKLSRYGRGA